METNERDEGIRRAHSEMNTTALSGIIGNSVLPPAEVEWILAEHGHRDPRIWHEVLSRRDVREEWLVRASRVPDARVLAAVIGHPKTPLDTVRWCEEYAFMLAEETDDPEVSQALAHQAFWAQRVVTDRAKPGR